MFSTPHTKISIVYEHSGTVYSNLRKGCMIAAYQKNELQSLSKIFISKYRKNKLFFLEITAPFHDTFIPALSPVSERLHKIIRREGFEKFLDSCGDTCI